MARVKDHNPFGNKSGGEIVSTVMGGGWGGYGGRGAGAMGRKTATQAKAAQSGSDLAKNFRASGKAGSVTAQKPFSKKTYQKSPVAKWLGF